VCSLYQVCARIASRQSGFLLNSSNRHRHSSDGVNERSSKRNPNLQDTLNRQAASLSPPVPPGTLADKRTSLYHLRVLWVFHSARSEKFKDWISGKHHPPFGGAELKLADTYLASFRSSERRLSDYPAPFDKHFTPNRGNKRTNAKLLLRDAQASLSSLMAARLQGISQFHRRAGQRRARGCGSRLKIEFSQPDHRLKSVPRNDHRLKSVPLSSRHPRPTFQEIQVTTWQKN